MIFIKSFLVHIMCAKNRKYNTYVNILTDIRRKKNKLFPYSVCRAKPCFSVWPLIQCARKNTYGTNNNNHKKKLLSSFRFKWLKSIENNGTHVEDNNIFIFLFLSISTAYKITLAMRQIICSFVSFFKLCTSHKKIDFI